MQVRERVTLLLTLETSCRDFRLGSGRDWLEAVPHPAPSNKPWAAKQLPIQFYGVVKEGDLISVNIESDNFKSPLKRDKRLDKGFYLDMLIHIWLSYICTAQFTYAPLNNGMVLGVRRKGETRCQGQPKILGGKLSLQYRSI